MHLRTLLIIAPGLLALSLSGCIKDRSEGATLPIEGLWVNTSLQNDLVIYEKLRYRLRLVYRIFTLQIQNLWGCSHPAND